MRRSFALLATVLLFAACSTERGRPRPLQSSGGGEGEGEGEGEGPAEGEGEGPDAGGEGEGEGPVDQSPCEETYDPADCGDPDANDTQIRALRRVNELRRAIGLEPTAFDPALNRAAQNHTDYYQDNLPASQQDGHFEDPSRPGFTGRDPGARAQAEGFRGAGIGEDMAFGAGAEGSVMLWYDSVYHRIPIVAPNLVSLGFGARSGVEVMDVALDGSGTGMRVLTPAAEQEGVPTSFNSDFEGPDPVLGDNVVGYPISVVTSRRDIEYVEASLIADGDEESLPLHIAHATEPHPGFLTGSVFIMSEDPMAPDTWYTTRLVYRAGGQVETQEWRFRTGR